MIKAFLCRSLCRLFGHKYRLKRDITPYIRELKCPRCGTDGLVVDVPLAFPSYSQASDHLFNYTLKGVT